MSYRIAQLLCIVACTAVASVYADEGTSKNEQWLLAKYDVNGDKVISIDEISEKRQKLYASMDLDADGGVTFGEYEYVDGVKRQMLLKARFNKLDLDQDGKLSSSEYCSYLGSFDRFDQDGDGNITTSEIDSSKAKIDSARKTAEVESEEDTSCLLWFCFRSSLK